MLCKIPPAKKKGGFGLVNLANLSPFLWTSDTLSFWSSISCQVLKNIPHISADTELRLMTIDILNMGFRIQEVEVNMTHPETGRNLKGLSIAASNFVIS